MHPATIKLHERLISLGKGMIKAWETWLQEVARSQPDLSSATKPAVEDTTSTGRTHETLTRHAK